MRFLLVDDHDLFTISIKMVLEKYDDVECVTILKDPQKIQEELKYGFYSLIILDIQLGDTNGLEIGKELIEKEPDMPVVFLTGFDLIEYEYQAYQIGAADFLSKSISPQKLYYSLKKIVSGDNTLKRKMLPPKSELTLKQKDILRLISKGHSQMKIADELDISVRTVQKELQLIYKKLDVHNVSAAVMKGVETGIVPFIPIKET